MAKTKFQAAVDLIMAPHKHMDYDGNDPHKGAISNFINLPRVKVVAPLAVAFTMAASAEGNLREASAYVPLTLFGFVLAKHYSRKHAATSSLKDKYFDTSPETKRPLDPKTASKILLEKKESQIDLMIGSSVTAAFSLLSSPAIMACVMFPRIIDVSFRIWRAEQVLNGNWAVETTLPKKQEQHIPANAKLAPQQF